MTGPPEKARRPIRNGRLWLALLGAAAAWSADELLGLALHQDLCGLRGGAGIRPALIILGLVAAGLALGAGLTALHQVRTLGTPDTPEMPTVERARFMAQGGLLLSGIFLFGIALRWMTVFFIDPCR